MTTIGLCMIVKNEAQVIVRCLESVRPLLDYVLIEDTGSTDGTQDIIRDWLARTGLPGEVFDEPWQDFAYNRTLAFARLRENSAIDYALIMDADDVMEYEPDFDPASFRDGLSADCYYVRIRLNSMIYERVQICSNHKVYRYRGVLHEFIEGPPGDLIANAVPGMTIVAGVEGARSADPEKYRRDAAVLELALLTEADAFLRSRYTFYLAQSYRDCGEYEKAKEAYLQRAELGFWNEEIYVSLLEAARLRARAGRPVDEVIRTYQRATVVPHRAVAIHGASSYCRLHNRFQDGFEIARHGLALPLPVSGLFLEPWIYNYGLLDEYAVNAYWAGHFQDSLDACERVLARDDLDQEARERVNANAAFARTKLAETAGANRGAGSLTAPTAGDARRIGLCMIVRNESKVITRCLDSVRPLIDFVLIEDTGSTDGTQAIIKDYLRREGLPGEVIEETWQDFAHNRSHALARLREQKEIDYALIMDADDVMVFADGFAATRLKESLTRDCYTIDIVDRVGGRRYQRLQICSNRKEFRYRGVLHEFLEAPPGDVASGAAEGLQIVAMVEGARSDDPDKYLKDALVLERALETETDPYLCSRYTFYLAQSLANAGDTAGALRAYLSRAELGFWEQEVFYSLYRAGQLKETLSYPDDDVIGTYLKAYEACPTRAESLHGAMKYCRVNRKFHQGYLIGAQALTIALPRDGVYVEDWIYAYGVLDEYSLCAYWIGQYRESLESFLRLLNESKLPEDMRDRVTKNAEFAEEKLAHGAVGAAHVGGVPGRERRSACPSQSSNNEPERAPMKLLLICGPWGSGTSAVAGLLERMGGFGLGPYFMTNDPDTPNSYESIAFRDLILQYASQPTISPIPSVPGAVQSALRRLQQRIEQQEFGPYDVHSTKTIFVKHPLSALLISEICEAFDTKLIYVMRPLEDIERTRLRRNWLPYFGAAGATAIYQYMADALTQLTNPTMTIDYTDLLASPMAHARDIARFADLQPSAAELDNAVAFIASGHPSNHPSQNVDRLGVVATQTTVSGPRLPVVCIFGADNITLYSSAEAPDFETRDLDCRCFPDDQYLERILIEHRPHVIITFGVVQAFSRLMVARFEVRRRWLHFADTSDLAAVGHSAFMCYLAVCVDNREEEPLVSVFTPTYRTGDRFLRPLVAMKEQTYTNWEWVIWDDSDDDGQTAAMVKAHADLDHRIRLIRPERHSGIIGEVKYNACALSRGEILVELDHDDALTPDALANVVAASKQHPDAGFYYTDYAEVDPHLNPLRYPDGWGYGLGGYRKEIYRGRELLVALTPGISPKTIRHLVAAPNHLRAWRRDVYFRIGGHNREIHVADDFELMIRTFLETRMVHIPRLGYVQYQDGGSNTQRVRNKDIQRHVRFLRWKYDRRIHDRFVALGVDDYIWNEAGGFSDFNRPNPPMVQVASITADIGAARR